MKGSRIIREIKLNRIIGEVHPIDFYFNKIISDLKFTNLPVFLNDSSEVIWYQSDGWVFYLSSKKFISNYNRFWKSFISDFGIGSDESLIILNWLVDSWIGSNLSVNFEEPKLWSFEVEKILMLGGIVSEWKIDLSLKNAGFIEGKWLDF